MTPKKIIALVAVKVVVLIAVVVGVVLNLGGCNTMHGIGKDLEKGGEVIQKAAK